MSAVPQRAPATRAPPRRRPRLPWLLGGYFVTRGIMFARSGLPQVADLAMVAMFTQLRPPDASWLFNRFLALPLLVGWITLVNATWAILQFEREYLVFTSYYVFNLLVFVLVARTWIRYPEETRSWLRAAVPLAVVFQLVVVLVDDRYRATGTFRNPNQLAYFGICALSVWMLTQGDRRVGWRDYLFVGLVAWLELRTISRAGLVGAGFLVAMWVRTAIRSPRGRRALAVVAVAGVLWAGVAPLVSTPEPVTEESVLGEVTRRLNARMSAVDELQARNVTRIVQYSEHTILGAGEGDLDRFAYDLAIEVHSTFGTLLFSYGVPGLALFLMFVYQVARRLPRSHWVYLVAIFLYSLTHNGLRFTYGWMVIALLAAIGETRPAPRERGRP